MEINFLDKLINFSSTNFDDYLKNLEELKKKFRDDSNDDDEKNMDEDDVIDILFKRNVEQIHKDFEVEETPYMDYPLNKNEELIAFRMCLNRDLWDEELVVDYHFRVKRNGKWMEKCGSGRVQEVEDFNESPWKVSEDLIYRGPITYFIRKCS